MPIGWGGRSSSNAVPSNLARTAFAGRGRITASTECMNPTQFALGVFWVVAPVFLRMWWNWQTRWVQDLTHPRLDWADSIGVAESVCDWQLQKVSAAVREIRARKSKQTCRPNFSSRRKLAAHNQLVVPVARRGLLSAEHP